MSIKNSWGGNPAELMTRRRKQLLRQQVYPSVLHHWLMPRIGTLLLWYKKISWMLTWCKSYVLHKLGFL